MTEIFQLARTQAAATVAHQGDQRDVVTLEGLQQALRDAAQQIGLVGLSGTAADGGTIATTF